MPLLPGFAGNSAAAIALIGEGWPFFEEKAVLYANKTLTLVDQLASIAVNVAPSEFTITFPDVGTLTAFVAPVAPVLDDMTFNEFAIDDAPSLSLPVRPELVNAPAYDVAAPDTIMLPSQPGDLVAADPGDPDAIAELVLPAAPSISLPDLPAFLTILEPEEPVIVDPVFAGRDPGDVPTLPNLTGTEFTEVVYTREILDTVVIKVRDMLAGNGGLPVAIEFALFERARDQISREGAKARSDIMDTFASRGFSQPPGAMAKRLDEQAQKSFDGVVTLAQQQAIEMAREKLIDVRSAVQQGIALEQMLIAQHGDIMARALASAKQMLDTHIALFNASVSSYNASIARLQVDADVFKSLIAAAQQKVELFKAKWDGQRAKAEVNKALADQYDSQVKGLLSLVEMFKGQIAGVEAQARIEATKIDAYRSRVQAYGERVKAHQGEWDGYTAAVNAQVAKFKSFEIGVNAYSARVNAWSQQEKTKADLYRVDLEASGLTLEQYKTRLAGVLAKINAESARLDAIARKASAQATIYAAQGQIESARTDANTRAFTAAMEHADKRAQLQLEQARARLQEQQALLQTQIAAVEGALRAMTQLTASVFSGVNFSAGVSGSGSESSSFSYSLSQSQGFNWSGETQDNNAPPSY